MTKEQKETGKSGPPNWVPISISIAALLVSFLNQYYSFLLQQDDLRAIVRGSPAKSDGLESAENAGIDSVTFINAGNRSAVVTEISMKLMKMKGRGEDFKCKGREPVFVRRYDISGSIMKPGEIVTPTLHPAEGYWRDENKAKAGDEFLICAEMIATTPDSMRERAIWAVSILSVGATYGGASYSDEVFTPSAVVKRTQVRIFGWTLYRAEAPPY